MPKIPKVPHKKKTQETKLIAEHKAVTTSGSSRDFEIWRRNQSPKPTTFELLTGMPTPFTRPIKSHYALCPPSRMRLYYLKSVPSAVSITAQQAEFDSNPP
jgi:hypothetical protein